MKNISLLVLTIAFVACEHDKVFPDDQYDCKAMIYSNHEHPKSQQFSHLIEEIVASGVPGMMLTVHDTENGYWSGAAGLADLASDIEMQPCNITRVGSTVKTFTAVSVLLLQEDKLLSIDDPIDEYLSPEELKGLKNAEQSTIRQLLQHSSGIYNYIQNLQFQTASLNELDKVWQPDELLHYARGKKPYFAPGTDALYSNTNYILLGKIIEKVTGKPFYDFFENRLFQPLGMEFTQFAAVDPVPDDIVRGYVDFYSNLDVINSTHYSGWDYYTADGGLISNAYDLNVFLTKLFKANILSESSMWEITDWMSSSHQDSEGFETFYGLGIFKIETDYGPAYLHSGDAIGYFASMVYFPNQEVTVTWAVNGNYGKIDQFTQSKEAMEKIFETILGT